MKKTVSMTIISETSCRSNPTLFFFSFSFSLLLGRVGIAPGLYSHPSTNTVVVVADGHTKSVSTITSSAILGREGTKKKFSFFSLKRNFQGGIRREEGR